MDVLFWILHFAKIYNEKVCLQDVYNALQRFTSRR